MRLLLVLALTFSFSVSGQREKPKRYSKYDNKTFHFGMMIGGCTSSFSMLQKSNAFEEYGLKSLTNNPAPGGQFGPLVSMNLGTPVVRLRFIPSFSFQERVLDYAFINPDSEAKTDLFIQERINSAYFDFPLMLQFRTLRLNNFDSYVLVGGQYSWDMQSQKNASQNFIDPFIKLQSYDWQAQLGAGIEFFTPYFKLGIELKYSHGLVNSFIQDGTKSSSPIDRLYNKVWSLSLIIEG